MLQQAHSDVDSSAARVKIDKPEDGCDASAIDRFNVLSKFVQAR